MRLELILMRHAKSDWTDPFQDDHDRVLNPRGRRSAQALGHWLCENEMVPDMVLCSSSARTQETWQIMQDVLQSKAQVQILRELYLARAQDILSAIQNAPASARLLVIGHNPGIGQAAEMILSKPIDANNFRRYPTGYTTVAAFASDSWDKVDWGQGVLVDHIGPRDLI